MKILSNSKYAVPCNQAAVIETGKGFIIRGCYFKKDTLEQVPNEVAFIADKGTMNETYTYTADGRMSFSVINELFLENSFCCRNSHHNGSVYNSDTMYRNDPFTQNAYCGKIVQDSETDDLYYVFGFSCESVICAVIDESSSDSINVIRVDEKRLAASLWQHAQYVDKVLFQNSKYIYLSLGGCVSPDYPSDHHSYGIMIYNKEDGVMRYQFLGNTNNAYDAYKSNYWTTFPHAVYNDDDSVYFVTPAFRDNSYATLLYSKITYANFYGEHIRIELVKTNHPNPYESFPDEEAPLMYETAERINNHYMDTDYMDRFERGAFKGYYLFEWSSIKSPIMFVGIDPSKSFEAQELMYDVVHVNWTDEIKNMMIEPSVQDPDAPGYNADTFLSKYKYRFSGLPTWAMHVKYLEWKYVDNDDEYLCVTQWYTGECSTGQGIYVFKIENDLTLTPVSYNNVSSEKMIQGIVCNKKRDKILAFVQSQMSVLEWDTNTKSYVGSNVSINNVVSAGFDSYERLWYVKEDYGIYVTSLTEASDCVVEFEKDFYEYTGTPIESYVTFSASNLLDDDTSGTFELLISGPALFTSNSSTSVEIEYTAGTDLTVPITIIGPGSINIYPTYVRKVT